MINQNAVNQYLARPVESFDEVKSLFEPELNELLAAEGVRVDGLWKHQKASLLLALSMSRFMFHIDMGGGKTRIMLETIARRGGRALVLVPYVAATETWVAECKKHTPHLVCSPLTGKGWIKNADIYVACYQTVVSMVADKSRKKWVLNKAAVLAQFGDFNTLILDEIQKCSNIHSLTYQMCRVLSYQCQYVYGLTGTPFGKDLQHLWPQFYLIDHGKTLGPTLGFYRSVFFNEKKNYWGGYEYTFKKGLMPNLQQIIKNRSIHYGIDELMDLPAVIHTPIHLTMPDSVEGYVANALTQLKEAIRGGKDYRAVEQNYLRLRQLSAGFLGMKGDEDGERCEVSFDPNPKLDSISSLVESLPAVSKLVIFHHFVYSGVLIHQRLGELYVSHASIYGGSRDQVGELRRFQTDENCRVLVINSKSGSSSLNLQVANYVVFYDQPDSAIDRQQAEKRVHRPGQNKPVWVYDLFMDGTYDERIYASNLAGKNLLKQLFNKEEEV